MRRVVVTVKVVEDGKEETYISSLQIPDTALNRKGNTNSAEHKSATMLAIKKLLEYYVQVETKLNPTKYIEAYFQWAKSAVVSQKETEKLVSPEFRREVIY